MNVYVLSYCPKCKTFHEGSQLSTHGADNLGKAKEMLRQGVPLQEIYNSFCGYCGSYIEGEECACGHTHRQRYFSDE